MYFMSYPNIPLQHLFYTSINTIILSPTKTHEYLKENMYSLTHARLAKYKSMCLRIEQKIGNRLGAYAPTFLCMYVCLSVMGSVGSSSSHDDWVA